MQVLADGGTGGEKLVEPDDGLTPHFKVTSGTWQKLLIPSANLEHVAGIMRETLRFSPASGQGPGSRLWCQARQRRDKPAQVCRARPAADTARASQGPRWGPARERGGRDLPRPCSDHEQRGTLFKAQRSPVSEPQDRPGLLRVVLTQPCKMHVTFL